MKRFLSVVLIMLLALGMVACGDDGDSGSEGTGEEPAATEKVSDKGDLGDYNCAIKDYKLVEDWEGKDSIKVTFEFTNNSDSATSFDVALQAQCFQDGVELESSFVTDDVDSYLKDVKPGATFTVDKVYILDNSDSDVETEVSELISFDSDKPVISKTFKIKK